MSPSHVPALGWTALMKPSLFEKKNRLQRCPTAAPSSSSSASGRRRRVPAKRRLGSVEIRETCPAGVFAEPGKTEGYEVFLSAGGGCVCPVFLCWTYRRDVSPSPPHFLRRRAPRIQKMPRVPTCFFSVFSEPGATEAQEGERRQRRLGEQPRTANFPRPA